MHKPLKISHRHLQILEIFANNRATTNEAIARQLGISAANVRNTLKNMRTLKLIVPRVGYEINVSFVNSKGISVVPTNIWDSYPLMPPE